MTPVRRSVVALADVEHYATRISGDQPAAAARFLDAVDAAADLLAEFPAIGRLLELDEPEFNGIRKLTIPGFTRFALLYRVEPDAVVILRVWHGSQDLGGLTF